jgi:putative nucleotidyltransferase with HDIG domain
MKQLPRAAWAVWLVTVVAGLLAVGYSLALLPGTRFDALPAVALTAAAVGAHFFTLRLPSSREHHRVETVVASALYVTAFLLLPPQVAILVATGSYAIGWAVRPRQRPWFKNLFNLCQYAVAVGLAGIVWSTGHGLSPVPMTPERFGWLIVALFEYFAVNTGSVSLVVAAAEGLPFVHVWIIGNRHTLPAYFGMIFVGALLAQLWVVAPWTVLLVAVPLLAIHLAFKTTVQLEEQTLAALFQLAEVMDSRDYYTHKHSLRVGEYAEKLALELGLPPDQAYLTQLAGRLHDIGKCAVDNEVLLKPGPLTDEERAHMSRHTHVGGAMLQHFAMFRDVAAWVRGHHERWDGSGYPDRLAGERIPIGARIIAVADSYDAMTTTRPYRVALPHREAVRRLNAGRDTQWDPRIVDVFLRMVTREQLRSPAPAADAEPALATSS